MLTDRESLEKNIREWCSNNIKDFKFRKNQLESIVYILNNILNKNTETTVVQAPTGTGKSLICIISAGVLATYYNMKSYILASDLYLWNQYAKAINKHRLKQFGYLKGSIGNYRCNVNNMDLTVGRCKINKIGIPLLRNRTWRVTNGYSCVDTCVYMRQRFRAEQTPVTLLTYQLWLYQMNLVEHNDEIGFLPRDVIFCDECHNIPDIVGKYAQPVIDVVNDRKKIETMLNFALDNDVPCQYSPACMRPDTLRKVLEAHTTGSAFTGKVCDTITLSTVLDEYDYFIDCLQLAEKWNRNAEVKTDIIRDFYHVLVFLSSIKENCETIVSRQNSDMDDIQLSKQQKKDITAMFKILSWFHNYESLISEFLKASESAGSEYVVIEELKDRMTGNLSYTLNCVKEDYLCYNFLLKNAKYKVMTSATVGNKKSYMDNIGTKYSENQQIATFMDIPNIFDFTKSPIYYIPNYKMSYANKKTDFPKIQQLVYKILGSDNFKSVRGMINTGSYENARAIYDNAPEDIKKRLCMYISSKDKADTIEKYTAFKNKVLIGPTLVEGVDLPDDLCRFIIIVKVPYPNISSKSVKAKMNIFPLWYESTTSNTVIQNIGRGVRNENDYCTTFILDGCFGNLYVKTKDQYPPEIRQRIHILNV